MKFNIKCLLPKHVIEFHICYNNNNNNKMIYNDLIIIRENLQILGEWCLKR